MTDDSRSRSEMDDGMDDEMDDDRLSEEALAAGDDIELIVEYLNKHLDPERMEQVRRRLDEDEAFRDLAAPLLITWSIPTHLERHPRPPGELERSWDEFTKRAGFAHQRRKARRRRLGLLALVLVALGVAAFLARRPIGEWYVTRRDFIQVPHDTGWIPLRQPEDRIFVQLAPDASLRADQVGAVGTVLPVILEGTARFLVLTLDSLAVEPRRNGIAVRTRGGLVSAGDSEFTVTARGDTTDVEVHTPSRRRYFSFVPMPTAIFVRRDADGERLMLRELERARLVRGREPVRLAGTEQLP
jgi:hypothetical protein